MAPIISMSQKIIEVINYFKISKYLKKNKQQKPKKNKKTTKKNTKKQKKKQKKKYKKKLKKKQLTNAANNRHYFLLI